MNIECQKMTKKAHAYNEDRYVIKKNTLYAVLDGASSLHKSLLTLKNKSQSSIFVTDIKNILAKYDGRKRLANFLYDVSESEYKKFKPHNMEASYLPACGIALVYFVDDAADFYCIGDCEIVIKKKDGSILNMKSFEMQNLNDNTIAEAVNVSKKCQISVKEALLKVKPTMINNRNLMNTKDGYAFFTIAEKPQFVFQHMHIDVHEVNEIYLYSDGFAQAYTTLGLYKNVQDMFRGEVDIKEMALDIQSKWKSDKSLDIYPRYKFKDDMTMVSLKIKY